MPTTRIDGMTVVVPLRPPAPPDHILREWTVDEVAYMALVDRCVDMVVYGERSDDDVIARWRDQIEPHLDADGEIGGAS